MKFSFFRAEEKRKKEGIKKNTPAKKVPSIDPVEWSVVGIDPMSQDQHIADLNRLLLERNPISFQLYLKIG